MRSPIIVVTVLAALTALVGCSSGDDESSSSSSSASSTQAADPVSFCSSICTKVSECDRSQDNDTCSNQCEKDLTLLTKLRNDVVTRARSCWEASDCRQVLSSNRLKDCVVEAAVDTTPSKAAKDFCAAMNDGLEKCGGHAVNWAECLTDFKLYSDATLADGAKCAAKSCGAIAACLKAAF